MFAWLFAHRQAALVYGAIATALLLGVLVPRAVRKRLRAVVLFGILFIFVGVLAPLIFPRLEHSENHEAFSFAIGAMAVVRLLFVLVVDLGVERARTRPMNALVRDVSQAALYGAVVVAALQAANLHTTSLIAGGTVATAVLGLSLQDTLGNLFAGIAIQIEQGVSVGDWIKIDKGDVTGRVVSMNWRAVTLEGNDHSHFTVPNGVFARTAYINYSKQPDARRSVYVVVPFTISPAVMKQALLAACADLPSVLKDPAPTVYTWEFNERGVQYWLRYWVSDFQRREGTQSDVATRVWYELNRLKVPFAVPAMHTYEHKRNEKVREAHNEEALQDRRACIDGVDFLKPLSEAAKAQLAGRGHRKLFAAGELILRRGQGGRSFFVVRRGLVVISIEGHELRRLGPGEFFGEMALLTGRQRTADVRALEETEVLEIDEAMFKDVIRGESEVAEKVSEVLGAREAELQAFRSHGRQATAGEVSDWRDDILSKIREMFAG